MTLDMFLHMVDNAREHTALKRNELGTWSKNLTDYEKLVVSENIHWKVRDVMKLSLHR